MTSYHLVLLILNLELCVVIAQTPGYGPIFFSNDTQLYVNVAVQWAIPPAVSYISINDNQRLLKEYLDYGRTLPNPELLQPTMDPQIPHYVPRYKNLNGTRRLGSTSDMVGVINDWILNFQRYHPGVHLLAPAPYDNNVVFPQLMNKTLDGIFLSREDTPVDVVNFYKKYGYEVTSVPILGGSYRSFGFIDPLVFCVHPSNPLNYVTLQQIDSIMSVTRNRGGPEITFDQDNGIANDKYGFGYSSLAYVDSPVKIIGIKDDYETTKPEYPVGVTPLAPPATGRQWHAPTYDELAAATYPLVRVNTWTTNNGQPGSQPDPIIEELTRYILSYEGQQVTLGYGIFMPLRAHQAADALAAWYQGGNTFDLNK
ncbi:hypothetical protein JCM24511_10184 [Saitozyma sp. JCM 24511]|nr:hypothetical protein JCM24511_10184 [Saitozyma sp. JCM 24511]